MNVSHFQKRCRLALLATALAQVLVLIGAFPTPANAATLTWNTSTGNWDTTTANWTGGATTFTSGGVDSVTFDGTGGGTVTVSANMSPSALIVNATSGSFTFTGGPISGTASLAKSNGGTLVLSSSNSYSGGTQISGGAIQLNNLYALGTGTVTFDGGTLQTYNLGSNIANRLKIVDSSTGTIAVVGGATNNWPIMTGAITGAVDTVLRAASSGGGQIQLSGNNSGFYGTFRHVSGNATVFRTSNSGSPNATFDAGSSTSAQPFSILGSNGLNVQLGALSGSGQIGFWQAGSNNTATFTIGGLNANATFAGQVRNYLNSTGTNSFLNIAKVGTGTQTFTGSSTFLGSATVSEGTLQLSGTGQFSQASGLTINGATSNFRQNSSVAFARPITFSQGTISGTGSIDTAVSVGANAILSPGNSPGSQAYTQGVTFGPGGQYTWEINNWSGAAGANYDQLAVSGSALNVTATSGTTFKIAITGLTTGNASGAVSAFAAASTTGTSFTIATSSAGVSGFDKANFAIDASGFTNNNTLPTNAGFWVSQSGNNLILNYAPSATYDLATTASASLIHVGGTSTITATVTSSTISLTSPDSLAFGGLAIAGLGGLSSTSGTLSGGQSGSGSVVFTGSAAGAITFNPSMATATNVNIGTNANGGSSSGVTINVFSGNGIWNTGSSGSWGSGANGNWTSTESVAAAPGTFAGYANTDSATFGSVVTGGTATIRLDGAQVSLASLAFSNTAARYVIATGTGAGSLTLAKAAGKPTIDVVSMHEIAAAIQGASGIQKTGAGKLILSGSSSYSGGTDVSAGTLAVNGSIASDVAVAAGAAVGGSGSIVGVLSGAGIVSPGNSPGILTATQFNPAGGLGASFEFTTSAPVYTAPSASLNDVLRLTDGTTPFLSALGSGNVINVYFDVGSITSGDTFEGGFFTAVSAANLLAAVKDATFTYWVRDDLNGTPLNGVNYSLLTSVAGITGATVTTISRTANFGGVDTVNGSVTQFVIVPEPDTLVFAGIGIAMASGSLWKRRRIVKMLRKEGGL